MKTAWCSHYTFTYLRWKCVARRVPPTNILATPSPPHLQEVVPPMTSCNAAARRHHHRCGWSLREKRQWPARACSADVPRDRQITSSHKLTLPVAAKGQPGVGTSQRERNAVLGVLTYSHAFQYRAEYASRWMYPLESVHNTVSRIELIELLPLDGIISKHSDHWSLSLVSSRT